MESSLGPLLPLFERERAARRSLVLGVLVRTEGSTYRKAGALILISDRGEYAGLISGGCLEGDLRDRAREVIETGDARIVSYDMRGSDDLLWGLGLGCEGAMQILLLRIGPDNGWQPLEHLAAALAAHAATAVALVIETSPAGPRLGEVFLPEGIGSLREPDVRDAPGTVPQLQLALAECAQTECVGLFEPSAQTGSASGSLADAPKWKAFILPLTLPPRILLLGAGPDAAPVVELSARLGWKVTVADHRPAYAQPARFPQAEQVLLVRPSDLNDVIDPSRFKAAVIMSHHLPSDLAYLRALAQSAPGYVGLLGPAARRERLFGELGAAPTAALRPRLRAPVGLALGGRAPESLALAIVAEIHQYLHESESSTGAGIRERQG